MTPLEQAGNRRESPCRALLIARLALVGLLVALVPLFLRMPLWCDTTHYDIAARNVMEGGIHYRDVFDTNLPGVLWIHIGIRTLLGWSSEALRLVDLGIVSAIVLLLIWWLRGIGSSSLACAWVTVALYSCYFSMSEHIHCQRDVWMMLPALVAMSLRRLQLTRLLRAGSTLGSATAWAIVEGICWGGAFWIKPFVIVPAVLCWLLSAGFTWRFSPNRLLFGDGCGILLGGLLAGGAGVAWLWSSGTWPHFWDTMTTWNAQYAQRESDLPLGYTLLSLCFLAPWSVVHFVAVPVALRRLWPGLRLPPSTGPCPGGLIPLKEGLLAAFYLGWLLQAAYLQHGFAYHHAPAVLLGLVVASRWGGLVPSSRIGWGNRLLCAGLLVAALYPALRLDRLSQWGSCVGGPNSPELYDRLALTPAVDWQDLHRVGEYLARQDLQDGELTCHGSCTNPLYLELGLEPSVRYTLFAHFVEYFPRQRERMRRELSESRQRYIVTDVRDWGTSVLTREEGAAERPGRPLAFPPAFPPGKVTCYPWTEPVVFRAGRYYVHKVTGPPGHF